MNAIEKVMVSRSTHFKLFLAVVALVLVLWVIGTSVQALWITALLIIACWIALQLGLRYINRRRAG